MVPLEWRLALAPLPLGARPQTSVKARDGGRTAFHNRVGEWPTVSLPSSWRSNNQLRSMRLWKL